MIEFQRSRVDTYSKASVDAFNRSIDTHNKLVIATKARQTDFNSAIDRHNVEANAYNTGPSMISRLISAEPVAGR